jgi:hypothetical protein
MFDKWLAKKDPRVVFNWGIRLFAGGLVLFAASAVGIIAVNLSGGPFYLLLGLSCLGCVIGGYLGTYRAYNARHKKNGK